MKTLTAKATTATRRKLKKHLGQQSCVEIAVGSDRPNVRLAASKIESDLDNLFRSIIDDCLL